MFNHVDRRSFIAFAAGAAVTPFLIGSTHSGMSPTMASRMTSMREAMARLDIRQAAYDAFWQRCEAAGLFEQDAFWGWYDVHPLKLAYRQALEGARSDVEAAFMTPPACAADEDAVMLALDAYEGIYPYAFAMQTARDLFTPRRHQTYPLDRLRHWLLTDPDEDFVKSGMPEFLRTMRVRHRALAISA